MAPLALHHQPLLRLTWSSHAEFDMPIMPPSLLSPALLFFAKLLRATISSFFSAVRAHVLQVRSARSSEKASTSCRSQRFALMHDAVLFANLLAQVGDHARQFPSRSARREWYPRPKPPSCRLTRYCRYSIFREPGRRSRRIFPPIARYYLAKLSGVELNGIEPMTSGLQSQRSPN